MTLAMCLVAPYGVWASVDHRLTAFPGGQVITDHSVKQVALRCRDGAALLCYSGLGHAGRIDVSRWMREVLRGESRTINESLIDLREQATSRLGMAAYGVNVEHTFLGGAFLQGSVWVVEIRNVRPETALGKRVLQPFFETAAQQLEGPILCVAGSGRDAISEADRRLLTRITARRPKRPEDFMEVLADVNKRTAESGRSGAGTVSSSCTVVFMPPSGDGVQSKRYGTSDGAGRSTPGMSHVLYGIDLDETARVLGAEFQAVCEGSVSEQQSRSLQASLDAAARRATAPLGRMRVRNAGEGPPFLT